MCEITTGWIMTQWLHNNVHSNHHHHTNQFILGEDKRANLQMLEEKIFSIPRKQKSWCFRKCSVPVSACNPGCSQKIWRRNHWMDAAGKPVKGRYTNRQLYRGRAGNYFNHLVWMLPNGQLGVYDKRHLLHMAAKTNITRQAIKKADRF